ncbi:virulence-associated E family protein [Solirhodobacter olei]|uniref:virulence-associated E family protein n=1 Tax=Solirhodobacter olei TaxID=2493082 RepID=UPI000FDBD43E|nr:virulence-associated E family protein [Solirhodobacter olei]
MSDIAPSRFAICHGTHRGKGKNDLWTATKLWTKFQKPMVDTSITWAKYLNLNPSSQKDQTLKAELKAKPGWYKMGQYEDGRRKLGHLLGVSAISLDLDDVQPDQIEHIRLGLAPINRFVWIGHTTRSHTPEKPRWRLIVFLDRMVDLDEANALARLLATLLADDPQEGVDMCDQVSFRNNQAMYWPSISDGQPYETDRNTSGSIVRVDEFLAEHPNWQDVTTLPRQEHEKSAAGSDPNKRFEDPRDKQGIIGAFCRAYDIEAAIAEFIPDVYVPGDSSGSDIRYTYALGSAANGAVVYDDGLVIYSNHGTDPIQGGANAWDMVRLHKFGHLDAKAKEDDSPTKLPSHKAMVEMASKDKAVKLELIENTRGKFEESYDEDDESESGDDFDTSGEDDDATDTSDARFDDDDDDFLGLGETDDDDFLGLNEPGEKTKPKKKRKWKADLRMNMETGTLAKSVHNAALILQNDPAFRGRVAFNEFSKKIVCTQPIDLPDLTTLARGPVTADDLKLHGGREWLDTDDSDVRAALAAPNDLGGWEFDVALLDVRTAVDLASRQNSIHPLRDRIRSFPWDGMRRAETVFIDYLGVEDNPYHRETCRLWLLAAVVRLFEPGHKWDFVPIFGGAQGIRKSTFVDVMSLGYSGALHTDVNNLGRMIESMLGKWIVEIGELTTLSKADSEEVKQFITETKDTFRLAYRHNAETFKRTCVFGGTTNQEQYLKDETGNRRYWPILCKVPQIDTVALEKVVRQIWAEVYTWYLEARRVQPFGTLPLYLRDEESKRISVALQDASRKVSPAELMAEKIEEWLNTPRDLSSITEGGDDRFDRESAGEGVMMRRVRAAMSEVWHIGLGQDREMNHSDTTTLGAAMRMVPGWTQARRRLSTGARTTMMTRNGSDWEAAEWEPFEAGT